MHIICLSWILLYFSVLVTNSFRRMCLLKQIGTIFNDEHGCTTKLVLMTKRRKYVRLYLDFILMHVVEIVFAYSLFIIFYFLDFK